MSFYDRDYLVDVIQEFKKWAKDHPVIYMDDIRKKFTTPGSVRPLLSDYIDVLVGKWASMHPRPCDVVKRTFLYYCDPVNSTLSLRHFSEFVSEMALRVQKVKIEHGTMVGIQSAQSISERLSQATLNSFHSTGAVKEAQAGIMRLTEVLDATKSPATPMIQMTGDSIELDAFLPRTLGELSEWSRVEQIERVKSKFSPWVLQFKLRDPTFWNKHIVNARRLNLTDWTWDKETCIMTKSFHKRLSKHYVMTKLTPTRDTIVTGIDHAQEVIPETQTVYFEPKTEIGTKMHIGDIFDICPSVDLTKLKCNDFYFIEKTFGIEAARCYLVKEVQRVLKTEGISINERHVILLVDNMCHEGSITPNTYSSVAIDESVILKATFQQATTTFTSAAAFGVTDELKDVSSQVLLGKTANMGVMYSHIVEPPQELLLPESQPEDTEMYTFCPSPKYTGQCDSPQYIPSSPIGGIEMDCPDSPGFKFESDELLEMDVSL